MLEVRLRRLSGAFLNINTVQYALIKRDKGAADSLEIKLSMGSEKDELADEVFTMLEITYQGENIFSGVIDEMLWLNESGANTLTVYARSMAALLIDNQVRPVTLRNPSLRLMEEMYLKPLGFAAVDGTAGTGELTLGKNTSVLKSIKLFCAKFMSTVPEVRGQRVYFNAAKLGKGITVKNLLSVSIADKLYNLCSDIYVKHSNGGYILSRKSGVGLGYRRIKYTDGSDLSANTEIVKEIQAAAAGFCDAYPYDTAQIQYFNKQICFIVDSVRLRFDSKGMKTEMRGNICG